MKKLSAPKWKNKLYSIDKIDKNKLSFYKYIKSKNIIIDFYHGTSSINIKLMEKTGWISPPSWRGKSEDERRYKSNIHKEKVGLDKIFFAKDMEVAEYYADRDTKFWNSDKSISLREEYGISLDEKAVPEILKISVPLFELDEIRGNVFNTFIYNESKSDEIIGLIIESDDSNEEKLNQILEFINESGFESDNEFTVKGGLPLKRVGGFEYVSKISNESDLLERIYKDPATAYKEIFSFNLKNPNILLAFKESFINMIKKNSLSVLDFFKIEPSFLMDDIDIKMAINSALKRSPYLYNFMPDFYKSDSIIVNDELIDRMKSYYMNFRNKKIYDISRIYNGMPDILKDDPDIIKWYKGLTEGSFSNWYKLSQRYDWDFEIPNVFGDSELVSEMLDRHGIEYTEDGWFRLYHGTPKPCEFNYLRKGSYLSKDLEKAKFYAARDRDLSEDDICVFTVWVKPDQVSVTGAFFIANEDIPLGVQGIIHKD